MSIKYSSNSRRSAYGEYEEKLFAQSIEKYLKIDYRKANKKEDMYMHIDFFLSDGRSIDVKTQKTINTKDKNVSKNFTWVEFVNNNGYNGWILGKATHIGFSVGTHYILVGREDLMNMVLNKMKTTDVLIKNDIPLPYKRYQREGLKDNVVLVPMKDILELKHTTLKRDIQLDH